MKAVTSFARPVDGRFDGAAVRMTHDDDQGRAEAICCELYAADLRGCDDVPRDPDDEQIAEPQIEHDFGGCARVGATEDDGEGRLHRGVLGAPFLADER